jgi:4-hydroxy-tetrahydrodipicolinate reductase
MAGGTARLCVVGAAGRIGQRLCRAAAADTRFELVAAVDTVGGPGAPVPITTDLPAALTRATVVVDFAAPAMCAAVAPVCAAHGVAYLVGSTGLGDADQAALDGAAGRVAVLSAANFSLGVNVLLGLVEQAALQLGDAFDLEIFELHHRHKRDAPSGTAHSLAGAARRARPDLAVVSGRQGSHSRASVELGIAAARGGDASGEHTVFFLGAGERLELTHRATTPEIFVSGALRAAAWLAGRRPGRYTMRDVLAPPAP